MRTAALRIVLFTLLLTVVPYLWGQKHSQNSLDRLVNRFEKAIKAEEPKFKAVKINAIRQRQNQATLLWVLDNDRVQVTITEHYDLKEAFNAMENYFSSPRPLNAHRVRLTNIREQAFLERKRDSANIIFRQGNVIIIVGSNKLEITERFAKHFFTELEKRN